MSTAGTDCISWSHRGVEEDIPSSGSARRRFASREEDNNSERTSPGTGLLTGSHTRGMDDLVTLRRRGSVRAPRCHKDERYRTQSYQYAMSKKIETCEISLVRWTSGYERWLIGSTEIAGALTEPLPTSKPPSQEALYLSLVITACLGLRLR